MWAIRGISRAYHWALTRRSKENPPDAGSGGSTKKGRRIGGNVSRAAPASSYIIPLPPFMER